MQLSAILQREKREKSVIAKKEGEEEEEKCFVCFGHAVFLTILYKLAWISTDKMTLTKQPSLLYNAKRFSNTGVYNLARQIGHTVMTK